MALFVCSYLKFLIRIIICIMAICKCKSMSNEWMDKKIQWQLFFSRRRSLLRTLFLNFNYIFVSCCSVRLFVMRTVHRINSVFVFCVRTLCICTLAACNTGTNRRVFRCINYFLRCRCVFDVGNGSNGTFHLHCVIRFHILHERIFDESINCSLRLLHGMNVFYQSFLHRFDITSSVKVFRHINVRIEWQNAMFTNWCDCSIAVKLNFDLFSDSSYLEDIDNNSASSKNNFNFKRINWNKTRKSKKTSNIKH